MAKPDGIRFKLLEVTRQHNCDGALYGHIHRPHLEQMDDLIVINTGDWVQNESFVAEHLDGTLELVNRGVSVSTRAAK